MRALRRLALVATGSLTAVIVLALAYVAVACALMVWPHADVGEADSARRHAVDEVPAWVLSNGVHTDLVFPIRGHGMDWTKVFPPSDLRAPLPTDAQYIAIGWGDREFYLHTPTWADLTIGRALGAAFGRNTAVLHVTYLRRPESTTGAFRLPVTASQYVVLRAHVLSALTTPERPVVAGQGYGPYDVFYEARGHYSMFNTCNEWTGDALRAAGLPAPAWSPFDFNVTWRLEPGGG